MQIRTCDYNRKWPDATTNDDLEEIVEPTQEAVEGLREAAVDFLQLLDDYLTQRGKIDSDWREASLGNWEDLDIYGDTVSFEWTETDRCGDTDYFRREFPLSDLWDPHWKERVRAENGDKDAKKAAELRVRTEEAKARLEAREKAELERLQGKYSQGQATAS